MTPLPPEMALDAEPFSDDELAAAFAQDDDARFTGQHDGPLRWSIDGVATAEWAMAKLAAYDGRIAEAQQQAEAWRARVDEWEREQVARSAPHAAFFAGHLERYALERREETGEKTLHLPSGKVPTVEHRPKVAVEDDLAVAHWAALALSEDDRERVVKTTVKAMLGELRTVVALVEVPDEVVMANCGCIVDLSGHAEANAEWEPDEFVIGSVTACPSCGAQSLVGGWLSTHLEVRDAKEGRPVPGTRVEPGHVTAKAVPGG